jgi:hypothetical protein
MRWDDPGTRRERDPAPGTDKGEALDQLLVSEDDEDMRASAWVVAHGP